MPFGWFKRSRPEKDRDRAAETRAADLAPTPLAVAEVTPIPAPVADLTPAPVAVLPTEPATPPAAARIDIPSDKIAARAYEIWVRKGRPGGSELQNWLDAEAELRAEFATGRPAGPLPRKPR